MLYWLIVKLFANFRLTRFLTSKCVLIIALPAAMLASGIMLQAQGTGKYGGVDLCSKCHPDQYDDWSKTPHSRSFELLVNLGQDKNAECLPCHSTAYGKGGFVDEATTPGLKGTACEACHGPGADHMGDKSKIVRVPSAQVCSNCHQKANIHSVQQ